VTNDGTGVVTAGAGGNGGFGTSLADGDGGFGGKAAIDNSANTHNAIGGNDGSPTTGVGSNGGSGGNATNSATGTASGGLGGGTGTDPAGDGSPGSPAPPRAAADRADNPRGTGRESSKPFRSRRCRTAPVRWGDPSARQAASTARQAWELR
jgi:hypothetical protein